MKASPLSPTRFLYNLLVAIFVAGFFLYVWPTLYRYDYVDDEDASILIRTNRINGHSQSYYPGEGWQDDKPSELSSPGYDHSKIRY